MDAAHLCRLARRRLGLSQRAFASAAGISRAQLNAVESGQRNATVAMLDRVLTAAGLDVIAGVRLVEAEVDDLRTYLRRPMTERLEIALDERRRPREHGPVWQELVALTMVARVVIERPLAVRLWLPEGPALPVRVRLHQRIWHLPPLMVVEAVDAAGPPPPDVIPVMLREGSRVLVPPPAELALNREVEQLRRVDALLHDLAPRDDAQRRRPAHRDPNEQQEEFRLLHTKGTERLPLPDGRNGRAWRLDVPASLAQFLHGGGRLAP